MSRVEHCHSNQSHGHCGGDEGRPELVRYEGERYNLDSERGRDRFEDAVEGHGVRYNRATNVVSVNGERYDLDTERGRRAFQADWRDGELDGR